MRVTVLGTSESLGASLIKLYLLWILSAPAHLISEGTGYCSVSMETASHSPKGQTTQRPPPKGVHIPFPLTHFFGLFYLMAPVYDRSNQLLMMFFSVCSLQLWELIVACFCDRGINRVACKREVKYLQILGPGTATDLDEIKYDEREGSV